MTVSYAELIPNVYWGNTIRIFSIWRGSLLKGVWSKMLLYCLLYAAISATYRLILSGEEDTKQGFERFCVFCNTYQSFLPLEFILGFYVSQVKTNAMIINAILQKFGIEYRKTKVQLIQNSCSIGRNLSGQTVSLCRSDCSEGTTINFG